MPKKQPKNKKKKKRKKPDKPQPISALEHEAVGDLFMRASLIALQRLAKKSHNPAVAAIARIRAAQIGNELDK